MENKGCYVKKCFMPFLTKIALWKPLLKVSGTAFNMEQSKMQSSGYRYVRVKLHKAIQITQITQSHSNYHKA